MEPTMDAILDWKYHTRTIPEAGLPITREATAAECAAVAAAMELVACARLVARYEIMPAAADRFLLKGSVDVTVTQMCVVTLEEIERQYSAPLDIEFWPAEILGEDEDGDIDPLGADREPIDDGSIDVGRIVYEELASAIDPFPRRDGAALDWEDKEGAARTHPFAQLARLKRSDG
jgi:uncharacterized metal-binding protein YceD (DUF177 family)